MQSELIVDISDLNLVGVLTIKLLPFTSRRGDNPILVDLTGSQSLNYISGNFGIINENGIGFMADRADYVKILDIADSQYNAIVFARPKHSSYMADIIGKINARILMTLLKLYNNKNNDFARSTIKVKE